MNNTGAKLQMPKGTLNIRNRTNTNDIKGATTAEPKLDLEWVKQVQGERHRLRHEQEKGDAVNINLSEKVCSENKRIVCDSTALSQLLWLYNDVISLIEDVWSSIMFYAYAPNSDESLTLIGAYTAFITVIRAIRANLLKRYKNAFLTPPHGRRVDGITE